MIKVCWINGKLRDAFETACETVKVVQEGERIIEYRYVNGGESDLSEWNIDEVINNLNSNGYFLSAAETNENKKIYYFTLLTIFSD